MNREEIMELFERYKNFKVFIMRPDGKPLVKEKLVQMDRWQAIKQNHPEWINRIKTIEIDTTKKEIIFY